jgi:hypothetical protein
MTENDGNQSESISSGKGDSTLVGYFNAVKAECLAEHKELGGVATRITGGSGSEKVKSTKKSDVSGSY